jgi:uncharacterized RmlC-like cupin family protein
MEAHLTNDYGSPRVDLVEPYGDAMAWMQNLGVQGYCSLLRFKAGARRSSHWHRTDSHWLYVLDGKFDYWWKHLGDDGKPHHIEVEAGQMVHTGPRISHWTYFPRETTLISVSTLHRQHGTHEGDVVRVPWHE